MVNKIDKLIPNSLPTRAWIAVLTVTLLFITSAISSGYLAWVAQEDAQAINTAGSIRMATYRIHFVLASDFSQPEFIDLTGNDFDTSHAHTPAEFKQQAINYLINDMQSRLHELQLYQRSRNNSYDSIDTKLTNINNQWQSLLEPNLRNQSKSNFYIASLRYIYDVDELVSQLQLRNEQRQQQQQILQLFSLILAVLVMLAGLIELKYKVLRPVRTLIKANKDFEQGQFNTFIPATGYREFNSLASSFNQMTKTIDTYQKSLEQEVEAKTAELTQANQVLSLLYDFAKHLTTEQVSMQQLSNLLSKFEDIIPELEFTLCLHSSFIKSQSSIALHGSDLKELCQSKTCESCLIKLSPSTQSFPIHYQGHEYGELRVRPKHQKIGNISPVNSPTRTFMHSNDQGLDSRSQILTPAINNDSIKMVDESFIDSFSSSNLIEYYSDAITGLTNLISTSLSLNKKRQQEHQIILLEERATMARELHDSLAQSLSYLKIQVSILESHLEKTQCDNPNFDTITESIIKLKEGLTSSYQHLRDLLVTFRLSLEEDSFDTALNNSVDEFAKKGGFEVTLGRVEHWYKKEVTKK